MIRPSHISDFEFTHTPTRVRTRTLAHEFGKEGRIGPGWKHSRQKSQCRT